ncbi:MAG: hypothetical protein MMC33_010431 [Icmadophila ericetorum]|nr:hypothetical protein [Icmadophila ericetorum]
MAYSDMRNTVDLPNLPSEVLSMIVSCLQGKERKALRVTNQRISVIASRTMFRSTTVSGTLGSMVQLFNVVKSDRWRLQVRHLYWVGLHKANHQNPRVSGSFLESHQEFLKYAQEQVERIGQEYALWDVILQCNLLKSLPEIETVRFWSSMERPDDIELQPLMSFGSTADGFRSLGRNRVRSLKRLVATGIEFDFKDVESDLKANNGLDATEEQMDMCMDEGKELIFKAGFAFTEPQTTRTELQSESDDSDESETDSDEDDTDGDSECRTDEDDVESEDAWSDGETNSQDTENDNEEGGSSGEIYGGPDESLPSHPTSDGT